MTSREWKHENYGYFSFLIPKELVLEFRKKAKLNGDVQRQVVIKMIKEYINGGNNEN